MVWLKSTNPIIDWVACYLELTVGDTVHNLLAFTVKSVANVSLSSLGQVLAKVKCGSPAWLGLLHHYSLLDTKGVLAVLGGGGRVKIPCTESSCWSTVKVDLQ